MTSGRSAANAAKEARASSDQRGEGANRNGSGSEDRKRKGSGGVVDGLTPDQ